MSLGYIGKREGSKPCRSRAMGFTDDAFAPMPGIRILTRVFDEDDEVVEVPRTWRDYTWNIVVIVLSLGACVTFASYSLSVYEANDEIILPLIVAVSIGIATLSWLQAMLSMNLLRCKNIKRTRIFSYGFYLAGAVAYASTALATMAGRVTAQFIMSMFGSIFAWIAFVTIFHGNFILPTRQQFASLIQIIFLTFLWETRAALINWHHSLER